MKTPKRTSPVLRLIAGLMSAATLWTLCLPFSAVAEGEDRENIALGKRAIACHTEQDSLSPAMAVDGDGATRFAAGGSCQHDTWYILDLGDTFDLSSVKIRWEAAHPSQYALEVSDNGKDFTVAATVEAADGGWVGTTLSATGRFLRIRELQRAMPAYGFSIWELGVYGKRNTARPNTDAYDVVSPEPSVGGTVTLTADGFVPRGTQVTVTVEPDEGNQIDSLTVGEQAVPLEGNKATFTVQEDTTVRANFSIGPRSRYECEDAPVFSSVDMTTPLSPVLGGDKAASGGFVAGSTGGKYYLFTNVTEANCVHIAYASPHTSSMEFYVRYPGESQFTRVRNIDFSTSNSWYMDYSYTCSSALTYIPEGSDLLISPVTDCNLDYLYLTCEPMTAEADDHTLVAGDLSEAAATDIMAPYGKSVSLSAGESVTITLPPVQSTYNVFHLSYYTEAGATLQLLRDGQPLATVSHLVPSSDRTYLGAGSPLDTVCHAGDTLTLRVTEGSLRLSHVSFHQVQFPDSLTVGKLPAAGERLTVCLDGLWSVAAQPFHGWEVPNRVPDLSFVNSICVPGLWHSAGIDLGSYTSTRMWLEKTVVLEEEPTGQVLLRIDSAQYGRYVYVNGVYAGEYVYNYSPSVTDISGLLHKGENTITVMLGDWAQQLSDPDTPAHVLSDGESTTNKPGITDSVYLIFNQAPEVSAVQTDHDLENGTVTVRLTLTNRTSAPVTSDVTVSVYELGTFENGVPTRAEKKVAEYRLDGDRRVQVAADGTLTLTTDPIALEDWSRDKCWTPDNPFLYRVEIQTAGDTYTVRFGMRTFGFDSRGNALLNGEICFLMGTNVAIERFFDDPLCGNNPWDEAWIRKLYSEYQDCGWFSFRTHLGGANSKWFDIADEMGFLIFDEYPSWGDTDGCTGETIAPELYAWIDTRGIHPSLVVFDAMNEGGGTLSVEMIRLGRAYDFQQRPWDNGWLPPVGEQDSIECHPYVMGGQGIKALENFDNSQPLVTTANIGWTAQQYANHPFILNEHGELWISRDGQAMSGTRGFWNEIMPNATCEERDTYYAEAMAAEVECFRAGRAYTGILFFCGLGSSPVGAVGVTSDILSPDVSTPQSLTIRPYIKELLTNAFSPLGICIDRYVEDVRRGQKMELPVVLINDTGETVDNLPITLVIRSGDTVVYADRLTVNVPKHTGNKDGLTTETFSLSVPSFRDYCGNGQTLTVTASYTLNGETVYSQRKWTIQGGSTSDSPLPVYDWLTNGTQEEDTDETNITETVGADTEDVTTEPATAGETTELLSTGEESTTTEDRKGGCASAVGMGVLALTATAAGVLKKKKDD